MAHFNNFGCYLIEVNLDDQSLFRLVLALANGISASLGLLVTFRQHELHSLMHFSSHLHFMDLRGSRSRFLFCLERVDHVSVI